MRYRKWRILLVQNLFIFVLRLFHLRWIQIETRSKDTLELCITCFSYQPKSSSAKISSMPPITSMMTSHVNLEGNNGLWPRMAWRVTCLSVTVWGTYLLDALLMKRWINIPRCPLLQLESGIHRILMTTANGMTLTKMQALVPTFLLPLLPNQMMSSSPSYHHQNKRTPASHFQMMRPSLMVLLTNNNSSVYRNLTPANLTIMMDSLHLL